MKFYLNQLGLICALGSTHAEISRNLLAGQSGIITTEYYSPGRVLALGCIPETANNNLPDINQLPLRDRSRNNQLALAALAQIRSSVDAVIEKYGADRMGIVIGTSTSGIAEGEAAFRQHSIDNTLPSQFHYAQQELGSPAAMLANILNISGPAYVHSNACASSGKALASAARLIKMNACDAVLTGGIDTLCRFTVAGFSALESVSSTRCNPLSIHRNGINIGEGAALFLMTREPATVALRGWGESSDAHHISAPDPTGTGARIAIEQALARAAINTAQIEYINLHGTATLQNDAMESKVVAELFNDKTPVSSTKSLTGHALGATSAIEAGLCWLSMQDHNSQGLLPPQVWDGMFDPALPALSVVKNGDKLGRPPRWILSNSFAFGGTNAALILGRE
jgi:3-oxoacyl-[acyl-carrier-protein] synthase I